MAGFFVVSCGDAGDYAAEADRLEATEGVREPDAQEVDTPVAAAARPVLDLSAAVANEPLPETGAPTTTPAPSSTTAPTAPSTAMLSPASSSTTAPATTPSTEPLPETLPSTPPLETTPVAADEPVSTTIISPAPSSDPPPPEAEPAPASVPAPPVAAVAAGPEPNCAVLCNIAMEGDSLTVGLGTRLCQAVQTGSCINSGIVGRRVDEMIVTARSDVDNIVGSQDHDVIILWAGTNDLWQKHHSTNPAENAAAVYENIKIFAAERRAKGWDKVFVMTLPPMNQQYVVGTDDLNALIRQNSAGADGVIDVGADPRLANEFDRAMRAADGIHFGDGGRAVVMEHILPAIRGLDGQ